jgi:hypothetical protein
VVLKAKEKYLYRQQLVTAYLDSTFWAGLIRPNQGLQSWKRSREGCIPALEDLQHTFAAWYAHNVQRKRFMLLVGGIPWVGGGI